ncbi:MAG: tRNA (N6-isopentenyl adenosine(37)-C2)-methylthiotransferase MiaB [Chloroflexi bacterium]|nr:tRNA (N6-isopentenyl adenosine(37)-C2)-methylthiotransferase MiaB [Chloroflexota bacterium]
MPSYHISTIGCQMNQADSARLAAGLERRGYAPAARPEEADLVVVNSCVVRQSAEERVAGQLGALKALKRARPQLQVALTGCLVDSQIAALRRRFPQVDFFFPPQDFQALWERLAPGRPGDEGCLPQKPAGPTAFLPVISGCDEFCAYCIVPYRRGRERSRPLAELRCEAEALARRGVRELTLLGQNVNAYGRDLPGRPDLALLLEELAALPGLRRLRFLTSHPADVTEGFIEAVSRLPQVCPSFSLPVQAGHDNTLRRMGRRGYTVASYKRLVEGIRQALPEAAISTDIIVGFPGETETEFAATLALLEELRCDTVHGAAYSPRPGTAAARLPDDVPPEAKKERLARLEALQERIAGEINAALLGRRVEALVEGQKGGKWWGRTPTGKLVFFADEADRLGQLVEVELTMTGPWSLQGNVQAPAPVVAGGS